MHATRTERSSRSGRGGWFVVRLLAVIVVGFLVFVGFGQLTGWFPTFETNQVDRTSPPVLQSIQDLSTYTAASGNFEVIVDLENDVNMLPDFIAGERTLMVAAGSVDAEIDFGSLDDDAITVSDDRTSVEIVLPAPRLAEAELDQERTYVASRDRGLFDRIGDALGSNPVNDQDLYLLAEQRLEEAATATDITATAERNTRDMLTTMMQALGFEEVTVTFSNPPDR
ncbi:MAG: DUF4230 domain-containing protein [Actinomycetota bacterium]|nr:DUF4230 domain-containing protein [Actinomycetota bacterium]